MEQENKIDEFGKEDEKYYFKNEVKVFSRWLYVIVLILVMALLYVFEINWTNLNQYNAIKSKEKYPVEEVFKEQISYYGNNYKKFKEKSEVNDVLKEEELISFWDNCVGSCEIPSTNRFKYISNKPSFVNWACNERIKEEQYSGTQYTIWKLNKEGCVLTNIEDVKKKDKEEIERLKWEKQKEMEIYLLIFFVIFLFILNIVRKVIKNK